MRKSNELLDLYAIRLGLRTSTEIADRLSVTKAAVSMWRSGKSHPNAVSIETMCSAIEEPLNRWLALIEAERSRSESERKVWLKAAQAAACAVLLFGAIWGSKAQAQERFTVRVISQQCILCQIMGVPER